MSKQLRLDVAQLTDVGRKRPHNEDNMAYVIPKDGQVMAKKGALFIVADGMGGHAAGEVASEIAVDTVSSIYYQDENDDLALSLMNAIKRANALIHQRAAENMLRSGMGTTCVAAVLRGDIAYVANVGDSRAYLVRKGQAKQVSQDHSWVEEQVRAGLLTKDQARSHAQRNVITRSLGTQADVEVDVFSEALEEGDTLILCSDGLSGSIGEDDLRTIINQYMPQESVYHLVERANENGGPDNITAIVARVQEVGEESPRTLYPVQVGGRITDENTAVLGRIPSSSLSMPVRVEDTRNPSGPLSAPSGPLFSPSASTQATVTLPHRRRKTRLLPLVILLVLLVILVVGVGGYLFFLRPATTQAKLNQASDLIVQANSAENNPNLALQNLARAQDELRNVKSSSLNQQQSSELTNLQSKLVSEFKVAISHYNKASLITSLPCTDGSPTAIDSQASRTTPSTLVAVKDEKNTAFSYVHMANSDLYQVDGKNNTLTNKYAVPVVLLTNDSQHIFVLTTPNSQGAPSYELHALRPGQNGVLSEPGNAPKVTVPSELITQGFKPQLMTTWDGDMYIVLTSAQSTQSNANQAIILDYKSGKLQDAPQRVKISISTGLIGVAAFPNKQLFLLHNDGTLKSLQVGQANPSEIDVEASQSIATPWLVDSQQFTFATPIVAPSTPTKNKLLSIPVPVVTTPPQSFLTAGQIDNTSHLYITDNTNHRILDFALVPGGSITQGTPASSATATPAVGGGIGSSGSGTGVVDMQLVQQYTSPTVLPAVRSSVLDPGGTHLDIMTMNENTYASVNVGVSQKNTCSSQ